MRVTTGHSKRSHHLVQLEGILGDALFFFLTRSPFPFLINLGIMKVTSVDHVHFLESESP